MRAELRTGLPCSCRHNPLLFCCASYMPSFDVLCIALVILLEHLQNVKTFQSWNSNSGIKQEGIASFSLVMVVKKLIFI